MLKKNGLSSRQPDSIAMAVKHPPTMSDKPSRYPAPCASRETTLSALCNLSSRAQSGSVFGRGPLILSAVPPGCLASPGSPPPRVSMGIDEAGRGPTLGPMVYAAAYWSSSDDASVNSRGKYADSKALEARQRDALFDALTGTEEVGFAVRVLHASEISRNMLRPVPYNLNAMSHDAAMEMIGATLAAGVEIDRCYVDTVGPPDVYRAMLERHFPEISFTVEKKADAKYDVCSAASIVAKVTRDRLLERWEWSEGPGLKLCQEKENEAASASDFGSGYPSDPRCKRWMEQHLMDPVFGYPDLVRFSWGPVKKALSGKVPGVPVAKVEFEADDSDDEEWNGKRKLLKGQQTLSCFDAKDEGGKKPKRTTFQYFRRNGIEEVTDFFSI
mmetsp:Transcript_32731/g.75324  ORF Transcript_32731/g.75324 Transcript_32731/m.75324 type:complete len:386 (-) Transcript_32731:25-1182(-)